MVRRAGRRRSVLGDPLPRRSEIARGDFRSPSEALRASEDDGGEDGYANWWQVETLDGEQLGRRELLHAHSTAPFTRSETVRVPAEVTCVVVRGHDQTHEYGGRAMLVNLESGATTGIDQGAERQSFTDADCS